MIIVYLIIASILVPLILEFLHRKAFEIEGAPAWLLTVAACVGVAALTCALPGGWPFQLQWVVVLSAFLFVGANAIFNLFLKPWRK